MRSLSDFSTARNHFYLEVATLLMGIPPYLPYGPNGSNQLLLVVDGVSTRKKPTKAWCATIRGPIAMNEAQLLAVAG